MIKALGHFNTITKHRHLVFYHAMKCGIPLRGLLHDLSKYSPSEFFVGARYFLGNRSPNEKERELFGYSAAWLHHKGRNRHHFEYWTDYNPASKRIEPVKMPLVYVIEMFCDRIAASKVYQGENYTDNHPLEYFLKAKARRVIHEETSLLLENWLLMLSEKGEKETFKYIKDFYKNKGQY